MTEVVGEAVLRIRTDDSGVDRGVKASGKKAGDSFASGFKGSLKGLAGAAGLAIGADKAFDFLKEGVKDATSFQDEMGALNVIIGKDGTAAITKFADTSADAFGISKVQALEASHTFATFGKSAGLSGKDLGEFSTKFAGLAGDLASFNGGSTEDAITAIGAALRGESEPIRRYGVLLDDMTLRQEAVRLGIIKNIKTALTPQQRVLAAQAAIFKQTKDAQGDAARTADSAANSQKRLTAELADLRLEAGQRLLPVITAGTHELLDFVKGMQDGTGPGGEFADVMGDVAHVAEELFEFIDALPGPVKKYGAELLIASFALSKVNSGLTSLVGNFKTTKVGTDGVARSSYALGGALRNLAGAGGLLLIQDGAKKTNKALGGLELAAGGAAVGFAVGGPLGAAIGGTTAGLYGLVTAMKETSKEVNSTTGFAADYASTLRAGTSALNEQTKALVAKKAADSGAIESGRKLGLSSKTVVNAILGSPAALAKVAAAQKRAERDADHLVVKYDKTGTHIVSVTDKTTKAQQEAAAAASDLGIQIGRNQSVLRADIVKTNERALALGKYGTVLKGVPNKVATRIDQIGLDRAADHIVQLTKLYHLTPKQVATVLRADGVVPTKKLIQEVINKAHEVDRQHPSVTVTANTKQARDALNALTPLLKSIVTGFGAINVPNLTAPGHQSGTDSFGGGISKVGEAGPELAFFPKGTRILSNARSQQFAARAGSGSGASAQDIGKAVATALATSGALGVTINTRETSGQVAEALPRALATTAFLLGG